jgi:hypothetical protein
LLWITLAVATFFGGHELERRQHERERQTFVDGVAANQVLLMKLRSLIEVQSKKQAAQSSHPEP